MRGWIAAVTAGGIVAYTSLVATGFAATPPKPEQQAPAPAPSPTPLEDTLSPQGQQPGGLVPCLLTCYIGPRAGLEYNEGRKVAQMEWIELLVTLIPFIGFLVRIGLIIVMDGIPAQNGKTMSEWVGENQLDTKPIKPPPGPAPDRGGSIRCLTACCLSGRVAYERNEGRRVRTKEKFMLIPLVNIVFAILVGLEAFNGKTMTQIAMEEGLDAPMPAAPAAAPATP